MEFYYHQVDRDVLIIAADGGIDSHNANEFLENLAKVFDAGIHKVIVDCSELRYISSYGVGVLIRLHKKLAQRGGQVKLAAVQGPLFTILRILRLDTVFHIYPSVERAREAFRVEPHR